MKNVLLAVVMACLVSGTDLTLAGAEPAGKTASAPKAAKAKYRPFRGRIKTVGAAAIVLEGPKAQTFRITETTKIKKDDEAVRITDVKVGEMVGGHARQTADGQWEATTLNVRTAAEKEPADKPKNGGAK